jgi:hypothetical protein
MAGDEDEMYTFQGSFAKALSNRHPDSYSSPRYMSMAHDWVVRGDIKDAKVEAMVKSALEEMWMFINAHMK